MMAARGMVPSPPEFTVRVLYQLSLDPDNSVSHEATGALEQMPPQVLLPSLQAEQPASVLDWIAELRDDNDIIEAVLLNKGTDDLTVAALALTVNSNTCDLISNNQVRILRSPVILENLYQNPNARMATIDKLIDLAQRNQVKLNGLPGLQNALDSGQELGSNAEGGEDFASLLQEEQEKAEKEEEEFAKQEEEEAQMTRRELELKREREAKRAQEAEDENKPLFARLQKMNIAQKIRLATVGSREAANLLVREANRLIHMAAIQSPRLKYSDMKKIASNKSMPDGVIRYLANTREWTRHYDIMLALVNNPKTPMADSMGFLNHLRTNDLRQVMKNRNVSHQISRQAKNIVTKRMSGGRGGG
jgi:FtsZ-interacting cell division protein YlmF